MSVKGVRKKGRFSYEEIAELYKTKSMTQIAELDGVSYPIINRILKMMGVPIRTRGNNEIRDSPIKHGYARYSNSMGMTVYRYVRLCAVQKLGGKCADCGLDDIRVLQINHIDGKRKANKLYKDCIAVLEGNKEVTNCLEVLCANCNILHEYKRGNLIDPKPLLKARSKLPTKHGDNNVCRRNRNLQHSKNSGRFKRGKEVVRLHGGKRRTRLHV